VEGGLENRRTATETDPAATVVLRVRAV